MKPLLLHGHERAITQIKYNREGDLLFTASKSSWANVWYSNNGERLGTYGYPPAEIRDGYGHSGAIWCLDVDWMSQFLVTGSGDNTLKFWDVETGIVISSVDTKSAVRSVGFSFSRNLAFYSTDKAMNNPSEIFVVDTRDRDSLMSAEYSVLKIDGYSDKVTAGLWGTLDEFIVTGHESGDLKQWDIRTGKLIDSREGDHAEIIRDMQPSGDGTMFITSSKDTTAKLFDMNTMECMKTFKTDRPVNSAALSPNCEHIVLGGGQEAMDVTSSTHQGKFEARFYHVVFGEEFARVKGHFGPINSVAFHPDGRSYSSGAEDGYVRIQSFDESYFKFKFDF